MRCPCECNSGGFCGGCGHAGCSGGINLPRRPHRELKEIGSFPLRRSPSAGLPRTRVVHVIKFTHPAILAGRYITEWPLGAGPDMSLDPAMAKEFSSEDEAAIWLSQRKSQSPFREDTTSLAIERRTRA